MEGTRVRTIVDIPAPIRIPMVPPTSVSTTASSRNCSRTSARRAPIALRTPISCVRSVTEISMMFITPIPPTSNPIELMTVVRITSAPVN